MRENIRSSLIAGLLASVIWMIITTALDFEKRPVIVGGLAFLVGTALVTAAISTVVVKARGGAATS